jgi:hypothetical protein
MNISLDPVTLATPLFVITVIAEIMLAGSTWPRRATSRATPPSH